MKRSTLTTALFLSFCLILPHFGHANWLEKILKKTDKIQTEAVLDTLLSQEQIADGLKEALDKGVQYAVNELGRPDGFLKNLNVKIPVPEKLRGVERTLRALGQDELADDFIVTMNRAAEQAVPEAISIFFEAIRHMTIADAKNILHGADDAATQYFRRTTHDILFSKFHPIVQRATEANNVTGSYKQLMEKVNVGKSLGNSVGNLLGKRADWLDTGTVDLDSYITGKALDGLFKLVAIEEKKIRENPAARTTELLRKVFGSGR